MNEKQRITLMNAIRSSGIFVTSGLNNPNVMSTHWGSCGTFWNKNVFVLPVRRSKRSHDLIQESKCFALSVPIKDMRNEIIQCDHLSGFATNKFDELHLHPKRCRNIPTFMLSECGLIVECRVLFNADMIKEQIEPKLVEEMYSSKDFHTMYFAEIIEAYENF